MADDTQLKSIVHAIPSIDGDMSTAIDWFDPAYLAAHHARVDLHMLVMQVVVRSKADGAPSEPFVAETGFMVGYNLPQKAHVQTVNNLITAVRRVMLDILLASYGDVQTLAQSQSAVYAQNQAAGYFLGAPAIDAINVFADTLEQGFIDKRVPTTKIIRCSPGGRPGTKLKIEKVFAPYIWESEVPERCTNVPATPG